MICSSTKSNPIDLWKLYLVPSLFGTDVVEPISLLCTIFVLVIACKSYFLMRHFHIWKSSCHRTAINVNFCFFFVWQAMMQLRMTMPASPCTLRIKNNISWPESFSWSQHNMLRYENCWGFCCVSLCLPPLAWKRRNLLSISFTYDLSFSPLRLWSTSWNVPLEKMANPLSWQLKL